MATNERAIKDLAEGLYQLARAVERLAQQQGDQQAINMARRGKRAGNAHR